MTKEERRAIEFEALICETNAIGAEMEGMKTLNEYRCRRGESQAYTEEDFQKIADKYCDMADKFRNLKAHP